MSGILLMSHCSACKEQSKVAFLSVKPLHNQLGSPWLHALSEMVDDALKTKLR